MGADEASAPIAMCGYFSLNHEASTETQVNKYNEIKNTNKVQILKK